MIVTCLVGVVILEVVGRNILYRGKLYFVNDIDHWNNPRHPEINSDSIRSRYEAGYFREEDFNIIFLGDSFVFGWLLPADRSLPRQFEKIAREQYPGKGIKAANFGWVSSSPLLSLRLLREIGSKYNPNLVILCLDMTDFHDEVKYTRLLERKGIYRLLDVCPITVLAFKKVLQLPGLDPLHRSIFGFPSRRYFITEQPLEDSLPWLAYIRRNIEEINSYCRNELNADFLLVILPRFYQYSAFECPENWEKDEYEVLGKYAFEPFRYFENLKGEVDYPIYSLLPAFQLTTYFPTTFYDDPHWTELGTRVSAEAIFNYCREAGYFDSVP